MNALQRKNEQGASAWQVVLGILGALALLVVLVVVAAVVIVQRFVHIEVSRDGGEKRVAVSTPFGEFSVEKTEDVARRLRLPVYPDAEPAEEGVSLRLWGRAGEEEGGLDVLAVEFRTSEPLERVDAWYREKLGAEYVRRRGVSWAPTAPATSTTPAIGTSGWSPGATTWSSNWKGRNGSAESS